MKYNKETATDFTSQYTGMSATDIINAITTLGANLDEIADTIGGYLYAITRLDRKDQEDVIWSLFSLGSDTFGVNVDQLGLVLSKYSQNTLKYVRKDKTLKRRKSKQTMVLHMTPLQAMNWRQVEGANHAPKTVVFNVDSVNKALDKLTQKAADSDAISREDLVHALRKYADELADQQGETQAVSALSAVA